MILYSNKWKKFKNKRINIERKNSNTIITNDTDLHGFILYPKIFNGQNKKILVDFFAKNLYGNGAILCVFDLNKNLIMETSFNSKGCSDLVEHRFIIAIKIMRNTKIELKNIKLEIQESNDDFIFNHLKNDILIITPSYPTEENKYFGGFVHSRVKAYKEAGLKFDLVCSHKYQGDCAYEFEGVKVLRTSFKGLRNILQKKQYKVILLHFFDNLYSNILDACDISNTNLYFWVHGPETLYWDWPKFTTGYFEQEKELTFDQIKKFKENDELIKRYNSYPNLTWVFVSNWIKNQSENLINIKFNRFKIIPNFIDEKNFNYVKKNSNFRKKIFFIRRFDNINKYAIDINVRTILELSRRDIFNELEFNIYGVGDTYDKLVAPIVNFENVHLHKTFATHKEISKIHKENGIGLFATRYDAQGVSMCEAAMSGLAIVSSQNDAISEFIPNNSEGGLLCETDNYIEYANAIEKLVKDEKYFAKYCKQCHDKVAEKCSFKQTVQKEIDMIKNTEQYESKIKKVKSKKTKVLSIIIPSYNVSDYLYHGVYTILNQKNADKIEVIIVNDGSKDNTVGIAKKLIEDFGDNIILIDKENGGHGSTINEGLKVANGKYCRIIDGDDWVNSKELERLIDVLSVENSDIVITDYSEDNAVTNELIHKNIYPSLIPGQQYKFDDLCYDGYGFGEWGPILSTANFNTKMLKKTNFKLTEKSFYVDMEFNCYSISNAETITYYPLDIYRYYIGRINQSISRESYKKNYLQHENVCFKIISFYYNSNISENKKKYIYEKLILPMIIAHYTIVIQFLKSRSAFVHFDSKLKEYPEIYNDYRIVTRTKKIHRKLKGFIIFLDSPLRKLKNFISRK